MELEERWDIFSKNNKNAIHQIDIFLTDLEKEYKKRKIAQFMKEGHSNDVAINKTRQSWVAYVGGQLEDLLLLILKPYVEKNNAKIIKGNFGTKDLTPELDLLRRSLLVHFNQYSCFPDADLIIYKITNSKVIPLVILSVKNSFRERYTETPYWKLKLKESVITKNIKVFMVTPDRDDEISKISSKPRKARIVLEYELDGIYITKHENEFDSSPKVGNLNNLIKKLDEILKTKEASMLS